MRIPVATGVPTRGACAGVAMCLWTQTQLGLTIK